MVTATALVGRDGELRSYRWDIRPLHLTPRVTRGSVGLKEANVGRSAGVPPGGQEVAMGRIVIAPVVCLTLALAVPAASPAAHGGKHHHGASQRGHHRHHAQGARLLHFGAVGVAGSKEVANGAAPSSPGTSSPETAGTVASFSAGVLTITLNDKSTVSGKVTHATELQCASATPPENGDSDDQPGADEQGASGDQGASGAQGDVNSQNAAQGDEHAGPAPGNPAVAHSADVHGADQSDAGQQESSEGNEEACPTSALSVGAGVREAELSVSSEGAVWRQLVLVH